MKKKSHSKTPLYVEMESGVYGKLEKYCRKNGFTKRQALELFINVMIDKQVSINLI